MLNRIGGLIISAEHLIIAWVARLHQQNLANRNIGFVRALPLRKQFARFLIEGRYRTFIDGDTNQRGIKTFCHRPTGCRRGFIKSRRIEAANRVTLFNDDRCLNRQICANQIEHVIHSLLAEPHGRRIARCQRPAERLIWCRLKTHR